MRKIYGYKCSAFENLYKVIAGKHIVVGLVWHSNCAGETEPSRSTWFHSMAPSEPGTGEDGSQNHRNTEIRKASMLQTTKSNLLILTMRKWGTEEGISGFLNLLNQYVKPIFRLRYSCPDWKTLTVLRPKLFIYIFIYFIRF